ncbi:MAG: glycosyltransferase family 2 protein, partial [Acidimicrobiia bacterium]
AETFARVGGFAASFFASYEDTDWCWRARLAGMSVRYEPAGVVRHVKGVSSGGDDDPKVVFLAARNRLHMLARNAPLAVFRRQVADAWGSWTAERVPAGGPLPPRVAVATRVARGLTERAVLSRRWARSPDEVFRQWAGVGETWDRTGW